MTEYAANDFAAINARMRELATTSAPVPEVDIAEIGGHELEAYAHLHGVMRGCGEDDAKLRERVLTKQREGG